MIITAVDRVTGEVVEGEVFRISKWIVDEEINIEKLELYQGPVDGKMELVSPELRQAIIEASNQLRVAKETVSYLNQPLDIILRRRN